MENIYIENEVPESNLYYYVVLNDLGYVSYCGEECGTVPDYAKEITEEQYKTLVKDVSKINAYKFEGAELIYDAAKYDADMELVNIGNIRSRRETECFSICDRAAWFYALSDSKKAYVLQWRQAWLDAPETGVIPVKPAWID